MADLTVNIAGVEFKNPVITASGTFGFGREYSEFYPLKEIGGLSCKGITLKPRMGNPPPRIAETPSGILNAVGLQNPGVAHFIERDLPWLTEQETVVIANIAGNTPEEYLPQCEAWRGSVRHLLSKRGSHHQGGPRPLQKAADGEAFPQCV